MSDKFIIQEFKESKKTRFTQSNKPVKNLANWGGEKGQALFVNRNGEYNGIVVELLEQVYPLYLTNSVHQIFLNIESNYTDNPIIIERFGLVKLFQEYSNEIFRFIVDKFLITNNLKPFYYDYPKINANLKNKDIQELENKIRQDVHELIPVSIKVISTGELLPEDWINKTFDSGESFHRAIDNLDSRINKPPVTYLANYCIEYVETKKIPLITELTNLNQLDNVWIQDLQTNKFIKFNKKEKLDKLINHYIIINFFDTPIYILFSSTSTFNLDKDLVLESNSIGFNVSLMQKSFRRGIQVFDNLVEAIRKLAKTKPYNNPEYQYELMSGSRQLVWRYYMSIIEDIQIYKSDKFLDIFDLVLYSWIFHNYPKYIISENIVLKLIELGKRLLSIKTHIKFADYVEDTSKTYNLTCRYQLALGLSNNYMPGMRGDKKMIRCLETFIKQVSINKSNLIDLDKIEINPINKQINPIYKKIGYYAGLDLHSNPQMIVQLQNVLYSDDKTKNTDLETCSGLIWNTSSCYNYRFHKFNWNSVNDLLYLVQYNWINPKYSANKLVTDYANKLWFHELTLNENLAQIEFNKLNLDIEYSKLDFKPETKLSHMVKPHHICQILLSSQFKNSFWFKSKKTQPIYTNSQIKFKYQDEIIDIESDLYEDIFKQYLTLLKTYSIQLNKIEYKTSYDSSNNIIQINSINSIKINQNKTIEYLDSAYKLVNFIQINSVELSSKLYPFLHKVYESLVKPNNTNPIKTFIEYKSIVSLQAKPNQLVKTNILNYISNTIKQTLVSRVLTALEDKFDRTILIVGQIDRSGKSSGDSVDSESEGYLMRLLNIFAGLFGCFQRVNEYKFVVDTKSQIFRYWLELMGYTYESTNKEIKINNTNNIIKTKLWEHQIKVRDMITENIVKFNQKGFGDASEVGSGKTLTALSVIEFINILNPNSNYLVLVPNTNLYNVWVDEIKSHCVENINCLIQESNGKWISQIVSKTNLAPSIYVSTMGRNRDNPLTKPINFVIIDECLSVQNKESKWTLKAFEQVVRAKYGVLMLSATFFRTRFDKLFFMLKMLCTGLPTKSEYLDTILNTAIGANIKTNRIKWETNVNKIKLDNKFYTEYNANKIADKFESYIKLKKYINTNVRFEELVRPKIEQLLKSGRKVLLFVESQNQQDEFADYIEKNNLQWGIYPDITKLVCLISKHKGTYGINNLVGYDTIIMKPPEPDKLPQIKGRLDRPGQKASTLYIEYIIIADTLEELDLVKLELANNFYKGHIVPLANYYDKYC